MTSLENKILDILINYHDQEIGEAESISKLLALFNSKTREIIGEDEDGDKTLMSTERLLGRIDLRAEQRQTLEKVIQK